MSSTEGHALTEAGRSSSGFLAWCSCQTAFWGDTEGEARAAWEAHVDRVAAPADPEPYGREEDERLARQLGAWVPVTDNGACT